MNIKLTIEYIGTNYCGWQVQQDKATIQQVIKEAIKKVTGETVELTASGRTDSGVHAYGQIANFHTSSKIPPTKFKYALNSHLPLDIRILESVEVNNEFHSRFGAKEKTYIYRIQTGEVKRAFENGISYYTKGNLDVNKMKSSAKFLVGEHDFSAFKSEGSSAKTFTRKIYSLEIIEKQDIIEIEITGNGFLYNMVRIIAGTLIEIGRDKEIDISEVLRSKDRANAGPTAPPQGLFLKNVCYDIDKV